MLNKVSMMGRLVRDPELRRTQSGIPVTTIRIAVDRDFKNADGSKQADFFDIVAWRERAEFISKYFTKGRMIVVDGRLQTRDWEDRDGNKRVSIEVVADNVYFGDSKRENSGEYGGASAYGSTPGYGSAPGYGSGGSGYGSAPGYGSGGSGYGSAPAYGSAPGYGSAPPAPQSDFSEIAEEDGDLPF